MKTYRRYFIGLLAACLCSLIIGCGPHRTTDADVKVIKSNLGDFWLGGAQFMLENGKPEARYSDIVGPGKPIITIKPVNGEDYTGLIVKFDAPSLSVKAADGREITYVIPR